MGGMFTPAAGQGSVAADLSAQVASLQAKLKQLQQEIHDLAEEDRDYILLLSKRAEWLEARLWELTKTFVHDAPPSNPTEGEK